MLSAGILSPRLDKNTIPKLSCKTSNGARFYNLGIKTKNRHLKPRLPQDLFIQDQNEDEDQP